MFSRSGRCSSSITIFFRVGRGCSYPPFFFFRIPCSLLPLQVYADLKGQFQVSSDKLGLTQRDLARARRLANNIQKEQKVAVNQLSDAIEMKASTEET